jgi:hypothetical protein
MAMFGAEGIQAIQDDKFHVIVGLLKNKVDETRGSG